MTVLFAVMVWMSSLAPSREHVAMATAIASVVLDEPPLFRDDASRLKTAALMVSVAYREGSFKADAIGDHGHALCTFQLWNTSRDVLEDQELCARIAMARLRESIRACGAGNELGIYAAGPLGCSSETAKRISRDRMAIAHRLAKGVGP